MNATFEEFQKLDIRTGVITAVADFPRAKKPARRVIADFGEPIGKKGSSVQATNCAKDARAGMQVAGAVNLPPKNIAGFRPEVLILGVPGQDGNLSILTPSKPAKLREKVC